MALTSEQRVTKSHIAIMRSKQFCMFAGVLSVGKVTFTENIPTACTNGRDVIYNPEFVKSLDDKELNFVVLHEALHKVYQHMHLWKKLWKDNPMLANMAADYVVNHAIYEADEQSEIAKRKEQGGHDTHDWEGAEQLSDEEVKETAKQIDQALRQGEIIRGKMNGNKNRSINELLEPKVDWREQLREFVNATCRNKDKSTWKRPHKRFLGQDIYMPSMIGESIGKVVVGIDTSGSIGDKELSEFLSEVVAICDDVSPSSIELLYWDTDVAGHETYNQGDYKALVQTTKPAGGGGTHVGCVNQYIKDKRIEPEAVIILTDGYVEDDWGGSWGCTPTLWAVTSRNNTSPHGKTIHIK
jgi:predicted metal-dependent peptidase